MVAFQLDTSGAVLMPDSDPSQPPWRMHWPDLSPFAQGYVEAMWDAVRVLRRAAEDRIQMNLDDLGFGHLAPETLARVLKDCEAALGPFSVTINYDPTTSDGARFWRDRQAGELPRFPPLTPYLGDDGRVYLREQTQ